MDEYWYHLCEDIRQTLSFPMSSNPKTSLHARIQALSIENCDKEQIHIPGTVQSFGALIAFDKQNVVTRATENVKDILGIEAEKLLGTPLSTIFDEGELSKIKPEDDNDHFYCTDLVAKNGYKLCAHSHITIGESFLDLVPAKQERPLDFFSTIRSFSNRFSTATNEVDLAQMIAEKIRQVSKFDRVKVYKFDSEWNGEVIAESREASMPSYLGLHFPASDIPVQARELYLRNRLRVIADIDDPQSTLIDNGELTPLDMSFSFVRSVSPIHLQYLRNMEVRASMSISLFNGNKFWGLVACHHASPKTFCLDDALFYYSMSEFCSTRITELNKVVSADLKSAAFAVVEHMIDNVKKSGSPDSLIEQRPSLDTLVNSTGCALIVGDKILKKNAVPDNDTIRSLIAWLERDEPVFACDDLPARYGSSIGSYACGLLATKIQGLSKSWILWFRFEISNEVKWAGDPFKPTDENQFGSRLFPRTSFALWTESRRGRSAAWEKHEIEAAKLLANVLSSAIGKASN